MPKDGGAKKPNPTEGVHPEALDACPDAMTLAAYLDGRLSQEEQAILELHLTRCRKCAKDVAELREIISQVELGPEHADAVRKVTARGKKIIEG